MSSELKCWAISDGRRGIENQALGLAEAIQRLTPLSIEPRHIESGAAFKAAPPNMQILLRGDPLHYGLEGPYPDIAIGCGRQAIAPLIALKRSLGEDVFTVYVQDPRIDTSEFDLVVAPEHDELEGDNVVSIVGAPNRISNMGIAVSVLSFNEKLVHLPMPRVAMLIGGDSKTHTLSKTVHAQHMKAARDVLSSGRSLLITLSRRTPEWVIEDYKKLETDEENVWVYDGGNPNPYLAFLGAADTILVTEDSTNMLTDACSSGKSVFTLPMEGDPGRFRRLYARLEERCQVKPYASYFKSADYLPLNETARAAEVVLQYMDLK